MLTSVAVANCSFCGKPSTDVSKLIAGPGVSICNECVSLCADILAIEPDVPNQGLPWDGDMPLDELLALLRNVAAGGAQQVSAVEQNLAEWVRKARTRGATWARIGETLGMTRQSAWERFSGEE
jgi:hypothetical protein